MNRIRLMATINQYENMRVRGSWILLIAALACSSALFYKLNKIPSVNTDLNLYPDLEYKWVGDSVPEPCDWSIVKTRSGIRSASDSSLAKRYRLAGTYIEYGGTDDQRRAILDDLGSGRQIIVAEAETIGDIQIHRIFTDHIDIRSASGDEQLWLSFAGFAKEKDAVEEKKEGESKEFEGEQTRFGAQIGERSWLFDRQALLDYYNELLDDPKRLVAVFDSLKPIYDDDQKINGYYLDVEGEGDFFEAVGLKPGDTIRAVNSMQMTSRHRAEYFIREFVGNRANAFLFDIERSGQSEKLVYRVR